MDKKNKRKEKIIDILFFERSDEIYKENHNDDYTIMERDINRLGEVLSDFLKENLSLEKYEIARDYLEKLAEKNCVLSTILNKRFYGAGFCDGIKM